MGLPGQLEVELDALAHRCGFEQGQKPYPEQGSQCSLGSTRSTSTASLQGLGRDFSPEESGVEESPWTGRSRATDVRRSFDARVFVPEHIDAEVTGRYDIDKHEIGTGGYGKVFVARDREISDRVVAIKQVSVRDSKRKTAFDREVHIMKDLDHPNICKLFETYEQRRIMYLVMEYCEGKEVFDLIAAAGQVPEDTVADIVRQVASALLYAHGRGIAHRDMKPENIVFCSSEESDHHVKVIDWGLGFYFGQGTMQTAVGSLTYAAPEVLEGGRHTGYTCSCDRWSLGVVAYVMICGRPPFWGSFSEQLRRMKQEKFPMSDSLWRGTSRHARDLICGLLRYNPAQRLSLQSVMQHPWLKSRGGSADRGVAQQVLRNVRQFGQTSQFFSIMAASVVRQLDHRSLRDVRQVFSEIDANGDGVLELHEVRAGFERILGRNNEQLQDLDELFARLDLDGSGKIDYTEFCAAGLGESLSTEEHAVRAAFKAFDVKEDDGQITREEIKHVLLSADMDRTWTKKVCEDVADEIFLRFDSDGDGYLSFQEWLRMMKECAVQRSGSPKKEAHRSAGRRAASSVAADQGALEPCEERHKVHPSKRFSFNLSLCWGCLPCRR